MHRLAAPREALERLGGWRRSAGIEIQSAELGGECPDHPSRPSIEGMWITVSSFDRVLESAPLSAAREPEQYDGSRRASRDAFAGFRVERAANCEAACYDSPTELIELGHGQA
jgi:hypothetical protein